MGSPPPEDAPLAGADADAGFEPSPTGATICGFGLPLFVYNLSFFLNLPDFGFPPSFNFMIALNCDLSDPIEAEFGFGGGRVGTSGGDADPEFG